MENNNKKNEINGYSLFNDIEDSDLQERNRAVVMANIAETYTTKGKITMRGVALITKYFNEIEDSLRQSLYSRFEKVMRERNYVS